MPCSRVKVPASTETSSRWPEQPSCGYEMVPAEEPAARRIRTVTASAGSVCVTVPDQVPARSAGMVGVAAGLADDVCAEAVVRSAATGLAVVAGVLRCVAMRVAATTMTPTQATQAAAQAARRDRDAVEVSAGPW